MSVTMKFSLLGSSVTSWKATISFFKAVRPDETYRLEIKEFIWNLLFEEEFSEKCPDSSSLIKTWQE
jgi:hypothetical protein